MNYDFHETAPCFLGSVMLFNKLITIYSGLIYYLRQGEKPREDKISVVSGILNGLPKIPCFVIH